MTERATGGWKIGLFMLAVIVALRLIGGGPATPDRSAAVAATPPLAKSRDARIESARAAIAREKDVRAVMFDDPTVWIVSIDDDGSSRAGYALYLCNLLDAEQLHTVVRMVSAREARHVGLKRARRIGEADCSTYQLRHRA